MSDSPLEDLRAANAALVTQVEANGATLAPDVLIFVRVDALVDLLLPSGPFRHVFDIHVEQRLHALLEQAVSQTNQAKLLQGVAEQQQVVLP